MGSEEEAEDKGDSSRRMVTRNGTTGERTDMNEPSHTTQTWMGLIPEF